MLNEIVNIPLDDIIPNRFQPREMFNETALQELSDSIKEHGVIQPIIVRKIGDKYEILSGLTLDDEVINNALFLYDADAMTNRLYDETSDEEW